MGYRKQRTEYLLSFADDEYDGLEIYAKSVPLRRLLDIQKLQAKADSDEQALEKIINLLADVIIRWNLEDEDGNAVICDVDGLLSQEMSFIIQIMAAWQMALATVPKLQPNGSSAGEISLEQSIPMEAA